MDCSSPRRHPRPDGGRCLVKIIHSPLRVREPKTRGVSPCAEEIYFVHDAAANERRKSRTHSHAQKKKPRQVLQVALTFGITGQRRATPRRPLSCTRPSIYARPGCDVQSNPLANHCKTTRTHRPLSHPHLSPHLSKTHLSIHPSSPNQPPQSVTGTTCLGMCDP